MKPIQVTEVQTALDQFKDLDVYLHLETTNGAYAEHQRNLVTVGAFIRNATIRFTLGKITGLGPYRVGLKLDSGWVYAEGLTHWEVNQHGQLLLAGHDQEGRLTVALQLSLQPF